MHQSSGAATLFNVVMRFGVAGIGGVGQLPEAWLALITVPSGSNSAGKSSLLEALRVPFKLARDIDHQPLIDPSAISSSGRFHSEYALGADIETRPLFEITPARLQSDYLSSHLHRQESPGISSRITREAIESERASVWRMLELLDHHGLVFDSALGGRPRLEWRLPPSDTGLDGAREAVKRRAEHWRELWLPPCTRTGS